MGWAVRVQPSSVQTSTVLTARFIVYKCNPGAPPSSRVWQTRSVLHDPSTGLGVIVDGVEPGEQVGGNGGGGRLCHALGLADVADDPRLGMTGS